jgi:hypothetical protein
VDWLSFPCSVLTLRCRSELAIRVTDTAIIRMDTTDHIGTMATILGHHTIGRTDTAITATTVIITTDMGIKLT